MKRIVNYVFIAMFFLLAGFNSNVEAQTLVKKSVSLELAKKIAAAAHAEAVKNKWSFVIAVVDDGGNLVYLERMDNTQLGSIEIAIQKARTAIFFKRPTKSYQDRIAEGNNAIVALPNVLPFEGGLPLIVGGEFIGALGVSGGSAQQDGVAAQAGVSVLSGN
jgi:uncharacterized protein GlcG (DUF336 family)